MRKLIKNQSGSYLAAVLIMIVILSVIGVTFLSKSKLDVRLSGDSSKKKGVDYAAESAVKMVAANLKDLVLKYSDIDVVNADTPEQSYSEPPVQEPFDRASYITACKEINSDNETLCYWLATKAELSLGLSNIDDKVNVSITRMDRKVEETASAEPYPWNKSLTDSYQVPFLTEYPEYAGLYSEKRVYSVTVRAEAEKSGAASSMQAMLTVYGVPMTQWLLYSNYDIALATFGGFPGSSINATGRVHTNSHFKAGTNIANGLTINPSTFAENIPVVTSSKKIWDIFKIWHLFDNQVPSAPITNPDDMVYKIPHDYHSYYSYADTTVQPKIQTASGVYEVFYRHMTLPHPNYTTEASPLGGLWDHCVFDDYLTPDFDKYGLLWGELLPSKYFNELYHVNVDDPAFKGRLKENVDPIYPPWFPKEGDSYETRELIEPGNSVPDGITDSDELKDFKLYYKARVRLLMGSDGVIRSLDTNGIEITSGKFSTASLTDPTNGIVKYEPNKFFEATKFRNANTITLDMGKLKADTDYDGSIIYVGSLKEPSGQVQIPTPGCSGPQLNDPDLTLPYSNPYLTSLAYDDDINWKYTPKCYDESGNDCLATCNAANVGSIDVVKIKNGQELNEGGISVATNRPVYVQGDYNTVNKQPAAVFADTAKVLSNSWEAKSEIGWSPLGVTGPQPVLEDVTQNMAIFAGLDNDYGFVSPFLEQFDYKTANPADTDAFITNTRNVNLNASIIRFWESKYMPPKAGTISVENWDRLAYGNLLVIPSADGTTTSIRWMQYYTHPKLNLRQDTTLGSNPPPGVDKAIFVTIASIKEIESN